ncbi:MAG TPA: CinA family protein [Rhizomicrobium sp.]|jgi:nicotinamide-nucleotide amidase|nr:CinA family protein [Rhizomicrobium sp.]
MFSDALLEEARKLLEKARSKGLHIVTAESCTGGLIAGLLTEIPGSSDVVERGFVTYSNEAKQELLGVPHALLETHGAVSEPVARAMAEGALRHAHAERSIAVTGIAGPGGGTASKPIGLVYVAVARPEGDVMTHEYRFGDIGRDKVRLATIEKALKLLRDSL